MSMPDQKSELDEALQDFAAAEANLTKLERLWGEIEKHIPTGMVIDASSPDAIAYEEDCRAFAFILPHLPAIDGFVVKNELHPLDEVFQMRFDAHAVDEPECFVAVERALAEQGISLREYRFRLGAKRRELIRDKVTELTCLADEHLSSLRREFPEPESVRHVEHSAWTDLNATVKQIDTLLGSGVQRLRRWADLHRHLTCGQGCDLKDIIERDWPDVKVGLYRMIQAANDPVPVNTTDLGALTATKPSGPVATALNWRGLSAEDFERLLFCLISDAKGYRNPEWLMRTNAPDRGRDLAVLRVAEDPLGGTLQTRVIIQCKHWLSKSVAVPDISAARDQMGLWEPPPVDTLVIATSGRFTSDAVRFVETHNEARKNPRIEIWPESHLERLLAARPHVVAEFGLR